MRDLRRNQQKILYSLLDQCKDSDEWGNTVDVKGYGTPKEMRISISANQGETSAQPFGAELKYDREMCTHNMSCPIDEYSRIWIDSSADSPHNYEVVGVSRSLNCIRYAIRKVNINDESYKG